MAAGSTAPPPAGRASGLRMLAAPGAYESTKPYAVPQALDELTGPTSGVVRLPVALDWGPSPTYDLADPARRRRLYTIVIREAYTVEDLRRHLHRDLLVQLWPQLVLPPRCTDAWHAAFPQLAARGTGRGRA